MVLNLAGRHHALQSTRLLFFPRVLGVSDERFLTRARNPLLFESLDQVIPGCGTRVSTLALQTAQGQCTHFVLEVSGARSTSPLPSVAPRLLKVRLSKSRRSTGYLTIG